MCGEWKGRYWTPTGCEYEDITPADARKCIGNRTLAFIGDSQIRDTAVAVAFLLLGTTLREEQLEGKLDKQYDLNSNGTKIEDFPTWKHNVPPHNFNGHVFPQKDVGLANDWQWQVQVWSLFRNEFIHNGQVEDVLTNKMSEAANNGGGAQLRPIDFAMWSHGLHDFGWWEKPPYGENYYNTMVSQWIRVRAMAKMPTVWVSMNPNCIDKLSDTLSQGKKGEQAVMIEEANRYVNERLLREKLPYWDAAAPLRSATRCNQSADGLHVKMYVDTMRAKMLLNHLCDHKMNWRGDSEAIFT